MASGINHEKRKQYSSERIIHLNTRLWFGKHKGKTPEEINDRKYFIYIRDNTTIPMSAEMIMYTMEKL